MVERKSSDRRRLEAEAADWFVRLAGGGAMPAAREQFIQWLLLSAEHVEVYLATSRVGAEVGASKNLPSVESLIEAARAESPADKVVSFQPIVQGRPDLKGPRAGVTCERRIQRGRPKYKLARVAAILTTLALIVGWSAYQLIPHAAHYQTQIGEQRSVVLAEGSMVVLNTNSELSVELSPEKRSIDLQRGEAQFEVARDPVRPFVVTTPQAIIRAVGTVFNVHITPRGTVVCVMEGKVIVTQRGGAADTRVVAAQSKGAAAAGVSLSLTAGTQALVSDTGQLEQGPEESFARARGWMKQQIAFQEEPLADVVAEFNRYHKRPLQIADPELATYEINGTFDAYDYNSLLDYLERYEGVKVDRHSPHAIVLRRKP
jgi:transmembrane sensor